MLLIPRCKKKEVIIPPITTVTDANGNVYNTVKIGSQTWMVENLKTTKFNDGTPIIPTETNDSAWAALTSPAYCWYNNNKATFGTKYGGLYNLYAVNTGKLSPIGWYVATLNVSKRFIRFRLVLHLFLQ